MTCSSHLRSAASGLSALASRARRDKGGVAALEFALLLPVMLLMYFASAEVTKAVMASRKVTAATRAMSDLLAQQANSVTDTTLADIFAAAKPVMSPFPATAVELQTTLSNIKFVVQPGNPSAYDAFTVWSSTTTSNPKRPCTAKLTPVANSADPTPAGVPTGLYGGGTVVVADVTYVYPSPFNIDIGIWKSPATFTFKRAIFNAPRNQTSIAYTGSNGTICP